MQKDMLFWIWLSEALGAAGRDFCTLIKLYDSPYDLFHADDEELERIEGISDRTKAKLSNKDLQVATDILDRCERLGIGVLPYSHEHYPSALRELREPPVLLYYRGELFDMNSTLSVGMVGTRKMSAYGMKSAYKIAYELASVGVTIVSGMAAGIDGVSSAAALAAGGKTVAFLGCGLDVVYPKHHKPLMDAIASDGVLFSEYPPATRPNHYHFPVRNRLISGVSQGTVVVEAGIGSGSLITARDAIVQGRDVFALPANVGSRGAEGTNGLLRDGANLVLGSEDILRPYQYVYAKSLRMELLPKAKEQSMADLHYLQRLGVIELAQTKQQNPNETLRAAAHEEKRTSRKATAKPKKTADEPTLSIDKKEPRAEAKVQAGDTPRKKPSDALLSSMTPVQLAVLEAIPDDRAVSGDFISGLDYPYGEAIAALTMLEIMGVIQKLPGGLYIRL